MTIKQFLVLGYDNQWYDSCDTLEEAQGAAKQALGGDHTLGDGTGDGGEQGFYIYEAVEVGRVAEDDV